MELTMADHYGDRGTFHDSCNRSLATGQPMAPRIGPEPPPRDEEAITRRLKQLADNGIARQRDLYDIRREDDGVWTVVHRQTGTEVGYKTSKQAAEDFITTLLNRESCDDCASQEGRQKGEIKMPRITCEFDHGEFMSIWKAMTLLAENGNVESKDFTARQWNDLTDSVWRELDRVGEKHCVSEDGLPPLSDEQLTYWREIAVNIAGKPVAPIPNDLAACPICHAGADLNTMKLHWTGMISCADCADATGDARGNH